MQYARMPKNLGKTGFFGSFFVFCFYYAALLKIQFRKNFSTFGDNKTNYNPIRYENLVFHQHILDMQNHYYSERHLLLTNTKIGGRYEQIQ